MMSANMVRANMGSDSDDESQTTPMQCSALRKGGYVMLKGHPCKIVEMDSFKNGKHGHAKVNLVGLDIFTGKKVEDFSPATHNIWVPNVRKNDYRLMDIDEQGQLSMIDINNEVNDSHKLPENKLGEEISAKFYECDEKSVTCLSVISAMGMQMVCAVKNKKAK